MPVVGGKYVAPTWINKQAPAINATELNAISQTLASLDSLQGKYYLYFGSYTGTGGEGHSHPTSIALPGKPAALTIFPAEQSTWYWLIGNFTWVALGDEGPAAVEYSSAGYLYMDNARITWGANSVSFFTGATSTSNPGRLQMNEAGKTYYYMAVIEA